MKKIFLTLAVLLPISLPAFGFEAIRSEGIYTFKEVRVDQVREQELVPSVNTARYNVLVQNGYRCQLRGDFFNCQKIVKNIDIPKNLKDEVTVLWKNKFFEFILSESIPSMTNESEYFLEWDVFDTVKFEGSVVHEYHYYLTKSEKDVHKFVLNFLTGPRWMVVEGEKSLTSPIQKTERKDVLKSRIFELSLVFNR